MFRKELCRTKSAAALKQIEEKLLNSNVRYEVEPEDGASVIYINSFVESIAKDAIKNVNIDE